MIILQSLVTIFLLPGSLVLQRLNISIEDDGGILRSLVNMIVWGLVGLFVVLAVAI